MVPIPEPHEPREVDGLRTPPREDREPLSDMTTVDRWIQAVESLKRGCRGHYRADATWHLFESRGLALERMLLAVYEVHPKSVVIPMYLEQIQRLLRGAKSP